MGKLNEFISRARWQVLIGGLSVIALFMLLGVGTSGSYASSATTGAVMSVQVSDSDSGQVPDALPTGVPRFVHICARTGSPRHPYIEIVIPRWALPYFIRHGAIYPVPPGGCPSLPDPIPTHVPTHEPRPTHEPTHHPRPTHVPPPPPTHGPGDN